MLSYPGGAACDLLRRMRWRWVVGLVTAGAAGLALGGAASAQEGGVSPGAAAKRPRAGQTTLDYQRAQGAEACPDEEAFRLRASGYFDDEDPFVEDGAAAQARLRIALSKNAAGYRGVLSVLDGATASAETSDQNASCDEVVWALAAALHLAMERKPVAPVPASQTPPVYPLPAQAEPLIVQRCDAESEENIKKRLCKKYGLCMSPTLTLMGGGLLTLGWTLNVGPGLWLGGDVRWENFSIGVEARGMFPESMGHGYLLPSVSDLVSFTGLVVPCARWKWLFGCVFAEAGEFIFTAPGRYGGGGDDSGFLFALGPRAGVDVPIASGFSIRAFADLPIHPSAPRVLIMDGDDPKKTVHDVGVPIINGFVSIGLAWTK